jgi:Polysaccharide deacetylase
MLKAAKHTTIRVLHGLGALALIRQINRHHTVILAYHGVLTGSDTRYSYLNYNFICAELFERQIRHICRKYRPISLSRLIAALEQNERPPDRAIVITFDDGFANNYSVAFHILQKYSVPFTVFLTTGMIDRPG